jgi:TrpR family trp operon transcriptional repressor
MNKKFESELIAVFQKASGDKELLSAFLFDILTRGEYEEVTKRWQIVKRLAAGEAQRTIARDLKVGIATVTRGSRELADVNGGFTRMLKKMQSK